MISTDWLMNGKPLIEWREYQEGMYEHALNNPFSALFAEMGLGKTAVCLRLIKHLMKCDLSVDKTLVIAPKKVASSVWTDEIARWEQFRGLKAVKIMGKPKERIAALKAKADIYIINVDNVAWLVDLLLSNWPFNYVILDESSMFKNQDSLRWRKISMVVPFMERVTLLSGTPTPEGIHDIWSQIYLLDQGKRLFPNITEFRDEYFKINPKDVRDYGVTKWVCNEENTKRIIDKISDISVSLKEKDYVELPPLIFNNHFVDLSDKHRRMYDEFEKTQILEFFEQHDQRQVTAVNLGVLTGKLIQYAGGSVYDENKNTIHIHNEKLDMVEELLETASGENVIIAYMFRHQLEKMQKRFGGHLYKDGDSEAWNKGKFQIMYIHPKSGAHGLNLQFGGRRLIMYSPTYSAEQWKQLPKRLHRRGQELPTIINRIITRDTMDEDCIQSVDNKERKMDAMMNAIKIRLKKYKRK